MVCILTCYVRRLRSEEHTSELLCPEIANDQISGSFKDEQLSYVMEALKFQYGFNYEITGNNVTINKSNQLKIK